MLLLQSVEAVNGCEQIQRFLLRIRPTISCDGLNWLNEKAGQERRFSADLFLGNDFNFSSPWVDRGCRVRFFDYFEESDTWQLRNPPDGAYNMVSEDG